MLKPQTRYQNQNVKAGFLSRHDIDIKLHPNLE